VSSYPVSWYSYQFVDPLEARSGNVLCQGVVLKYEAIQRCRDELPVSMMCRWLKVSPGGHYDWEGVALPVRSNSTMNGYWGTQTVKTRPVLRVGMKI
jgi:hypothetical protein